MDLIVRVGNIEDEIKYKAERILNAEIEKIVKERLSNLDINDIVLKRVDYLIDRSKYVSDSVIRNLVQQRVAKEITKEVIGKL